MTYHHHLPDGTAIDLPLGKVVCVGRNYVAHIHELGNSRPDAPVLFIKPSTSVVPLEQPFAIPVNWGACHHELELAVLIGAPLSGAGETECTSAIAGVGLALDLTLREVQDDLKAKGLPWERAKAFDGSCPLGPFVEPARVGAMEHLELTLERNGQVVQQGSTGQMIWPVTDLLVEISKVFTLLPGDVVLTGTPAGVGPLAVGDRLVLRLGRDYRIETQVAE